MPERTQTFAFKTFLSEIAQRTCTNFALFLLRCRCPEKRFPRNQSHSKLEKLHFHILAAREWKNILHFPLWVMLSDFPIDHLSEVLDIWFTFDLITALLNGVRKIKTVFRFKKNIYFVFFRIDTVIDTVISKYCNAFWYLLWIFK